MSYEKEIILNGIKKVRKSIFIIFFSFAFRPEAKFWYATACFISFYEEEQGVEVEKYDEQVAQKIKEMKSNLSRNF